MTNWPFRKQWPKTEWFYDQLWFILFGIVFPAEALTAASILGL